MRLWIYIFIYILSVADVILTRVGIGLGIIEEANPLVDFYIDRWPNLTMAAVLILIAVCLYVLYRARGLVKWLPIALLLIFAGKLLILALHFCWVVKLF